MNWLLRLFVEAKLPPKRYTRVSIDELIALPAGVVQVWTDDATGHSWAIMNRDDFEHIASCANMKLVDRSAIPTSAQQQSEKP